MLPTRRHLLVAGALGVVSACTDAKERKPLPVDPDAALLGAALAREQRLLQAYDEALAAHPQLAVLLSPIRDEHLQHLQRLSPEAAPTPTPTGVVSRTRDLPAARRAALARLESSTGTAHAAACLTASRRLAPVLASLAASEASHLVVL